MSAPAKDDEQARLEAAHAAEHSRRCALETVLSRLALLVGQEVIDRAWRQMELRHGQQVAVPTEEASE